MLRFLRSEGEEAPSSSSETDLDLGSYLSGVTFPASRASCKSSTHSTKHSMESNKEMRNLVVEQRYLVPKKLKASLEKKKGSEDLEGGDCEAPDQKVDWGDSSDSDNSIGEDNLAVNRFKKTEKRIVDLAVKKQEVVTFDYLQFQNARRAKWYIQHFKNLELIMARKANERQKVTHEWSDEDMDVEFAKVYGPVDTTAPGYKELRDSFRSQRMEFLIELFDKEEEFLRVVSKVPHLTPLELGSAGLKRIRKQLENDLMSLPEATIDINPYSSSSNMDFFLLPRQVHPVSAYRLKATEMANLVEFNLSDDEWSKEGYNMALCDVGCSFPEKIVGDHRRRKYLEGVDRFRQRRKTWDTHLLTIKEKLREYSPMGVESKLFFENYRSHYGLGPDEKILGKYSDDEAPFQLSDVFHPRVIGRDKRIILFPSELEGMIAEPMELLQRFLKRVRCMLEEEKFIKLDLVKEKYELWFGHSFDPLNWGFKRMEDFIDYVCQLFPNETGDVKIVSEKEKAATEARTREEEERKPDDVEQSAGSVKTGQSYEINFHNLANCEYSDDDEEDTWFEYTETLPSNFFFQ